MPFSFQNIPIRLFFISWGRSCKREQFLNPGAREELHERTRKSSYRDNSSEVGQPAAKMTFQTRETPPPRAPLHNPRHTKDPTSKTTNPRVPLTQSDGAQCMPGHVVQFQFRKSPERSVTSGGLGKGVGTGPGLS